jgi:hypothetical protein
MFGVQNGVQYGIARKRLALDPTILSILRAPPVAPKGGV